MAVDDDITVEAGPNATPWRPWAVAPAIGRYTLGRFVAGGGGGLVYEGHDPQLDRKVAIKLLRSDARLDEAIAHQRREARAMARFSDPHIVPVYDVGAWALADTDSLAAGVPRRGAYVVMELVEGRTLAAALPRPAPWRDAVRLMLGAARGLASAHAIGLVHRDFKPSNVMVDRRGTARVLDFGLAHWLREELAAVPSSIDSPVSEDAGTTQRGTVAGTPGYMAPEQHTGAPLDARCDQFAFCVTLFELLHGRLPFQGHTLQELAAAKHLGLHEDGIGPRLPRRLRALLRRGLAPERADRWPTMVDVEHELAACLGPRRGSLAPVVAALAVGAAGLGVALREPPRPRCEPTPTAIDEVWHARREALLAALDRTQAPYAATTAANVGAHLDAFAGQWRALADSCPTGAREPVARCLRQRLLELDATIDVLAEAPEQTIEYATPLVRALPSPPSCERPRSMTALDAASAGDLARLLARASAMEHAGRWQEALAVAREASALARATASPSGEFDARLRAGEALLRGGEFDGAKAEFEAAYFAAAGEDDAYAAGLAALRLARVIGLERDRVDEGMAWLGHAAPWLELAGAAELTSEQQLIAASLTAARGDEAGALAMMRAVIAELEQRRGREHPDVGVALFELATPLAELGHLAEARTLLERSLAIARSEYGTDHPRVAQAELNLGSHLLRERDSDEARLHLNEALRIWRSAYGPMHPDVARALLDLGLAAAMTQRIDEAIALTGEALAIFEHSFGPDSDKTAQADSNLGRMLDVAGRPDEALGHLERALATWERLWGPDHPRVGTALFNLGRHRLVAGDAAGAARDLARVLPIWREVYDGDHPRIAAVLLALAGAHEATGAGALAHDERVHACEIAFKARALDPGGAFESCAAAGTGAPLGDAGAVRDLDRALHLAAEAPPERVAAVRAALAARRSGP